MKKNFISAWVIGCLSTINTAVGQQGLSVSLKVVPQWSFLHNEDDKNRRDYRKKLTVNAGIGAGAEYGLSKHAGVGVDAILSFQGQRYTLNNVEYNQKVNYVKMPVYFTYSTNALKTLVFLARIGPQFSFVSDANFSDKDGNKLIKDTKASYKPTTFGGLVAAGVQYSLSKQVFVSTTLRFDYDFTSAEDNTCAGYISGRAKTYNSTAGLEAGLKYMLR